MPPAWRLAIKTLCGRPSRSLLLIAAVALSAALVAAIASAMASLTAALEQRVKATVGAADLRIRHVGNARLDGAVLEKAAAWPEIRLAVPRARELKGLKNLRNDETHGVVIYGIDAGKEPQIRPLELTEGTLFSGDDQVVLDSRAARELQVKLGDTLEVESFGDPVRLRVVGVVKPPPLGALVEREEAFVSMTTLGRISGLPGKLNEIDLILRDADRPRAEEIVGARKPELPASVLLQSTARLTSGLEGNVQSQQIGFVIASVLAFLAAGFIVMTGLTTDLTERTRELAVLRSIGGTRGQLAGLQVCIGLLIGVCGALIGSPLGFGAAYAMVVLFPEQLPGGFAFSWLVLVLSTVGAVGSGALGASYSAVVASRTSPLEGLSVRARTPHPRWFVFCLLAGIVGVVVHAGIVALADSPSVVFWSYVIAGIPCLLTGYFLLGVPLMVVLGRVGAPVLSRVLALPPRMLDRSVSATPFRHGFTASSMMLGLAMMVSILTNGRAVMNQWLTALALPDGFAYALNGFTEATREKIARTPGIALTSAIAMQNVEMPPDQAFGIKGLTSYKTTFVGFEADPFFKMTRVKWIQGDPEEARVALNAGGAVIIAREFQTARGLNKGDFITLSHQGRSHQFKIVGVITSPGLDIASKFLEVGEQYVEQAVNAVCGSREDMKRLFGNDAINFVQFNFAPGADQTAVMKDLRRAVGLGVPVFTAAEMKDRINTVIASSQFVIALIAIAAMLVACTGVANLIIASVQQRTFEFGVLRALGARRGLLARLVLAEALLIAVAACILGTAMGLQGAWGGQRLSQVIIGLMLRFEPEVLPIALGCVAVVLITVAAAVPSVVRLVQRHPRELLAATKG